jgi:hypothetical protein
MRGASWLASTNQSWKLEASALSRWIGVGVTALGARLSVSRFAALGTVLAVVGVLIGFLGPVVLRLMIVCPTCRFRPYFHAPLVRGIQLRQAEGCPRCGGNESADLVPLKTEWTIGTIAIVLIAIWLLLAVLPDAVLRRGVAAP